MARWTLGQEFPIFQVASTPVSRIWLPLRQAAGPVFHYDCSVREVVGNTCADGRGCRHSFSVGSVTTKPKLGGLQQ